VRTEEELVVGFVVVVEERQISGWYALTLMTFFVCLTAFVFFDDFFSFSLFFVPLPTPFQSTITMTKNWPRPPRRV
jgi:hypothetical protein